MMGWLVALLILFLLGILPLGASVLYDEDGPRVRILAGPVKIQVFPMKKKAKKDKPKKESKKKPAKGAKSEAKSKSGGTWTDFLPLVRSALDLLNDFRRKLRVNELKLHLTMAGDDPCDLAVNYGRIKASLASLIAQMGRFLVIKKRDVHIDCDFAADETVILARLDLTITLGRILSIAAVYGVKGLITFLNIKKQREGGADL